MLGVAAGLANSMLDAGVPIAEVLDACNSVMNSIDNPFKSLSLISYGSLENYKNNTAAFVKVFENKAKNLDSFYLGKMLGDAVVLGVGIGIGVEGIITVIGGIGVGVGGTAGGGALAATGAGAPVGGAAIAASISAAGAAVAAGVTTTAVGYSLVMAAWGNYGGDKKQYDYYKKLQCEEGTGNLTANWKSVKEFGHTFNTHGSGAKNTKSLTDRARSTGTNQGQWLDNQKSAEYLKSLGEIKETITVSIPNGLGQVITPTGKIVPATKAIVVPSETGIRTAYPIL